MTGVAGDCIGPAAAPVVGMGAAPGTGVGRRCALLALGVALFAAGDAVAGGPVDCAPGWGVGGCGDGECVDTALFIGLGALCVCAGGGMAPLAGPYWIIGRATCCWDGFWGSWGAVFCLGPLTAYMVASTMCGSMVIVTLPILVMESLGGFLGSSMSTPFFLCGFVQYFSKSPSLIHRCLDRASDSASTPLREKTSQHEVMEDWEALSAAIACTDLSEID